MDWTDLSAQAGDSALPGYLHLHCVLELSNKDYLFHSQLDLEFLFRDTENFHLSSSGYKLTYSI